MAHRQKVIRREVQDFFKVYMDKKEKIRFERMIQKHLQEYRKAILEDVVRSYENGK